jgi:membrane-associated protease RseP (regulator of RpoE activity)
LIIVHELSHGVLAVTEKIKVKSLGLLTAGIFPIGAFTEPDEKQLNKATTHKRLRVYSAGSMMNFMFAFAFLALFIPTNLMIGPGLEADVASHAEYYLVNSVTPGSPAEMAGITEDTKIYNAADAFENRIPGRTETLQTDKGSISVIRDSGGLIGLTGSFENVTGLGFDFGLKQVLLEILLWTATLNFLIGAINYLPFAIFDGARMFEDILTFYTKKLGSKNELTAKKATKLMSYFVLLLFLINVLPYFVKTI